MKVSIGQIAPVWMNKEQTLSKVVNAVTEAAEHQAAMIAFGESLVPGYPLWLDRVDGARFESPQLKSMHAAFMDQCIDVERDLGAVRETARRCNMTVVLGVTERAADRGGHSLYCSLLTIGPDGTVRSVHRKLMPTYEERLVWGIGDGNGLVSHDCAGMRMTALNCWENWMPTVRAAMYATGTDLHVASWPGSSRLTKDITRFVAIEGRCFVVSASSILRPRDIPQGTMLRDEILKTETDPESYIMNGGSAVAGPDGEWLLEPVTDREGVFVVEIDAEAVRAARQNLDVSGHYARPEVLQLTVDRRRHGVTFTD